MYLSLFLSGNDKLKISDDDNEHSKISTIPKEFYNISTDTDNSGKLTPQFKTQSPDSNTGKDNISEFESIPIQKFSGPKFSRKKFKGINDLQSIKISTEMKNLQSIAKGSYGTVYKGINNCDKIIAIKSIPFSESGIECLFEASIMSSIVHPYINRAHNIICSNNSMNILQTLADADLHTYCRKNKIGKRELKKILWQIAQAISCLHKENIIHGDIKAQNILMCDGIVKLCDFTLSVKYQKGNSYTTYTGTPTYRPPEVWLRNNWDLSSDIWSLGCTFYEIAKGRLLFPIQTKADDNNIKYYNLDCIYDFCESQGQTVNYTRYDTDYSKHRIFDDSGAFGNLLLGMLQIDPNKRLTITEILNHQYFKDQPKEINYCVKKNKIIVIDEDEIQYAQNFYKKYDAERSTLEMSMNIYRAVGKIEGYSTDLILLACLLISSKLNFHQKFDNPNNIRLYDAELEICKKLEFRLHCEIF